MARAGTDLPPPYQGCPDPSQSLLLTSLTALTCSTPNLAPGQSEKKGGPCRLAPWSPLLPPLYHLPPTAAAWEAAGMCTKALAPACNRVGPWSGSWEKQPRDSLKNWKAGKKGVCISHSHGLESPDSTPSSGELSFQQQRTWALPQVHTGHGRAQESHFPRDVAFPILC